MSYLYLEVKGSSGAGKSTFINFIIKACSKSKMWSVTKHGPHALRITNTEHKRKEVNSG